VSVSFSLSNRDSFGYQQIPILGLNKRTEILIKKLDLILDHLNLQYVPESTETKEARLEEKEVDLFKNYPDIFKCCDGLSGQGAYNLGYTPENVRLAWEKESKKCVKQKKNVKRTAKK
jgi:hypothetical protein